jgi:hypothetical protein
MTPISAEGFEKPKAVSAGAVPMLQWLKIADLVIDPAYQRPIIGRGRQNVERIARAFSWSCFAPVVVSPVRIPANADSDSDRLRTAIPIDRGQRSGDRGQRLPSTALRAHSALSVSSFPRLPEFSGGLRRVSPSRARRCAVWTRRSRTASAIVGSTITSCQ